MAISTPFPGLPPRGPSFVTWEEIRGRQPLPRLLDSAVALQYHDYVPPPQRLSGRRETHGGTPSSPTPAQTSEAGNASNDVVISPQRQQQMQLERPDPALPSANQERQPTGRDAGPEKREGSFRDLCAILRDGFSRKL